MERGTTARVADCRSCACIERTCGALVSRTLGAAPRRFDIDVGSGYCLGDLFAARAGSRRPCLCNGRQFFACRATGCGAERRTTAMDETRFFRRRIRDTLGSDRFGSRLCDLVHGFAWFKGRQRRHFSAQCAVPRGGRWYHISK